MQVCQYSPENPEEKQNPCDLNLTRSCNAHVWIAWGLQNCSLYGLKSLAGAGQDAYSWKLMLEWWILAQAVTVQQLLCDFTGVAQRTDEAGCYWSGVRQQENKWATCPYEKENDEACRAVQAGTTCPAEKHSRPSQHTAPGAGPHWSLCSPSPGWLNLPWKERAIHIWEPATFSVLSWMKFPQMNSAAFTGQRVVHSYWLLVCWQPCKTARVSETAGREKQTKKGAFNSKGLRKETESHKKQ